MNTEHRKSYKGMAGILLIVVGIVLIVNSIFDVLERDQ